MIAEWIEKVSDWLILHLPVRCEVCFRWMTRKTAIFKPITTGGDAALCPECDRAIFRPFTNEQRN